MSSNQTTTTVNNPDTAPVAATLGAAPAPRPFVMPKLVKQGKVATLTGDEYGASNIPDVTVP